MLKLIFEYVVIVIMTEYLSDVEKFTLAYLWYEYGGAIYFSRGGEEPELFLAKNILDDLIGEKRPHFYDKVLGKLSNAFKKLTEYWMIELSGYEVKLTSYGQQVVGSISKEEYQKLKEKVKQGKV